MAKAGRKPDPVALKHRDKHLYLEFAAADQPVNFAHDLIWADELAMVISKNANILAMADFQRIQAFESLDQLFDLESLSPGFNREIEFLGWLEDWDKVIWAFISLDLKLYRFNATLADWHLGQLLTPAKRDSKRTGKTFKLRPYARNRRIFRILSEARSLIRQGLVFSPQLKLEERILTYEEKSWARIRAAEKKAAIRKRRRVDPFESFGKRNFRLRASGNQKNEC